MLPTLATLSRYLEPCGLGNPTPVYGVRRARLEAGQVVGTGHYRCMIADDTATVNAIAFGWADRILPEWRSQPVDVAFKLELNEWRNRQTLQAQVVGIAPAAEW